MAHAQPLISVIITCFNYAQYVGGAIESALSQTYPHKEIIVINDGSSDDSLRVIAPYGDRVRVITQENQGSIAAYNRGYSAASGDVIVLLDADDLLEPSALEQVARVWSPTLSKVQWDLRIIDAQGRDLGRKFCNFDASYDAARVRKSFERTGTYRWPVSVGNAYARALAEAVFPLSVDHGPDGALNTVAPLYGDVVTLPEVLASYRVHGSNLWSTRSSDAARLPQRIEHRQAEVALLREHARRRGVSAPPANALDHEIAFINYRLMATKLGLSYAGSEADSTRRLLQKAYRVLRDERYPPKLSLAHGLWFGVLALSPRVPAAQLIRLRFQRSGLKQSYKDALGRLLRRGAPDRTQQEAS